MKFSPSVKLRCRNDFDTVFQNQTRRWTSPSLMIIGCVNIQSHPRLGMVIAKKRVKRAVDRNRLKRILRQNFREKFTHLPAYDFVVLVRRPLTKDQLSQEIDTEVSSLFRRII